MSSYDGNDAALGGATEAQEGRYDGANKPKEGLTKPLVNNVGGVIDQDAPSADQLLKGQQDPSWDKTPLREGDRTVHRDDDGGLIPDVGSHIGTPLDDTGRGRPRNI